MHVRMIRSAVFVAVFVVVGVAALLVPVPARADGGSGGSGGSGGGGTVTSGAGFQGLGQLGGGIQSYAEGVSGDGKVVVGFAVDSAGVDHAFRWTAATGMQDLGNLGALGAEAYAANSDGSVIVGTSHDSSSGFGYHGFRWTAAGGMQSLPILDGLDVSADGSVVTGGGWWTQSGGLQQPIPAPGGGCCSSAQNVSPDGAVISGWTLVPGAVHAFRWTSATGTRDLGTLGGAESVAGDASLNGSVVVGQSRDKTSFGGFWRAFSWTATTGMRDLGTLGGPMSAAYGVSGDGSVIVGKSLTTSSSASEHAFRWTTTRKLEDLQRALLDAGVTSVQNWILLGSATGVSADGTVIVGFGLNPNRTWEAFRATLPLPH
jgi:probable HAF family extracellular repeat protein